LPPRGARDNRHASEEGARPARSLVAEAPGAEREAGGADREEDGDGRIISAGPKPRQIAPSSARIPHFTGLTLPIACIQPG
jgi:hypothetical protein